MDAQACAAPARCRLAGARRRCAAAPVRRSARSAIRSRRARGRGARRSGRRRGDRGCTTAGRRWRTNSSRPAPKVASTPGLKRRRASCRRLRQAVADTARPQHQGDGEQHQRRAAPVDKQRALQRQVVAEAVHRRIGQLRQRAVQQHRVVQAEAGQGRRRPGSTAPARSRRGTCGSRMAWTAIASTASSSVARQQHAEQRRAGTGRAPARSSRAAAGCSIPHTIATSSSRACRPTSARVLAASGSQLGTGSASSICAMRASRSRQTISPA